MSVSQERLIPDEPVSLSPSEQSQLLDAVTSAERRARDAEKALEKRQRALEREADSKFGFLTKLNTGTIKCCVYRENPTSLEFEYVPDGKLLWDVTRDDKAAFQDRLARLFGGGRYKVDMQFPKESQMEDGVLEISIADKPKESVVEKVPVVSNESSVAAQFATVLNEMQKSNRELLMVVMQQGEKANTATLEAMKAALTSPNRDSSRDDTMLKLVTAAMARPVVEQQKQPNMLEMLTGMATLMGSLKTLMPQAATAGVDTASLMSQIVKAMELGAGLASNGGGGGGISAEGGTDMLDKITKIGQMLMPFLGGLLTPKPQMSPIPQIQQPPPRPPQPAQTRPQPRDVRPTRPQPARPTATPTPQTPGPQTAGAQIKEGVDMAKAKEDIDKLVDEINNALPEDAAVMIKQNTPPQFVELAKSPDSVMSIIGQFRPELVSDGMFNIKLRQVCAALSK